MARNFQGAELKSNGRIDRKNWATDRRRRRRCSPEEEENPMKRPSSAFQSCAASNNHGSLSARDALTPLCLGLFALSLTGCIEGESPEETPAIEIEERENSEASAIVGIEEGRVSITQQEQPGGSLLRASADGPRETRGSGARFGTWAQQDFEDNWQTELTYNWTIASKFNDELDATDQKVFYKNLHDEAKYFTDANDQVYLEDVNLIWISTHGGISNSAARMFMWDEDLRAYSDDLYLGNEGYGLSFFSAYSCNLLADTDHLWDRWSRAFKGGMRMLLGSHGLIYFGYNTRKVGEKFADSLQSSKDAHDAWYDGLHKSLNIDNDAAVVVMGDGEDDCYDRMEGIKWQNYTDYPRRRDGDVNHWLRYRWRNI